MISQVGVKEPGRYIGQVKEFDPINGEFRAMERGVYLVTANVHLELTTQEPTELTPKAVSIAMCIDGDSNE